MSHVQRAACLCFGLIVGLTLPPQVGNSSNQPTPLTTVLYNQYNNLTSGSVTSQNFLSTDAVYCGSFLMPAHCMDSYLADDFIVPANQIWNIERIEVSGEYTGAGGPASSVNVRFFENSSNLPGNLIEAASYAVVQISPSFVIPITPSVVLTSGTYWVSVQANMDIQSQWFWHNRTVQSNSAAAWINPLDGFGTGCVSWQPRAACGGGSEPDQVFLLIGAPLTSEFVLNVTGNSYYSITNLSGSATNIRQKFSKPSEATLEHPAVVCTLEESLPASTSQSYFPPSMSPCPPRGFVGEVHVSADQPITASVQPPLYLPLVLRDFIVYFDGPSEAEPNDTYTQANGALRSGVNYTGYHNGSGDDRDYFSVYLSTAGTITADLTGYANTSVQLALYDQSGTNRIGYAGGPPYHIVYAATPGTYYVRVFTPAGYSTSAAYTLKVTYP